MNSILSFPQTLINSVSSRTFYQEILKQKFGQALKYFILLTFLLAVVKSTLITISLVPNLEKGSAKLSQNIVDFFPADLTVTITGGQVSINAKEPYAVPLSALDQLFPEAKSDLEPANGIPSENLIVIDTNAKSDDFPKYKTVMLVTKSGFVIPDNETSGFRYYPIPQDTDLTIDRRLVRALWSQASPYLKWVTPGAVAIVWIWFILWYPSWYSTYLIFGALLVMLLSKMVKNPISFGTAYKVGLYSITVPILVTFVLSLFGNPLPIPLLFTIIFIIFTLQILKTTAEPKV